MLVCSRMRARFPLLCLSLVAWLFCLAAPASAQLPVNDARFGIVEAFVNSAAASEAGAGYSLIILRWDVIQPASIDDWKPANVPDPFIDAELAAGRELAAILMGTPAWAAATPSNGDPRAVPSLAYWERFVRRVAQQYQGRIRHWIIWNEPDVWDTSHPGSTWLGSEQDYFQLLKTAYLALKDVDPTAKVHMAGLTYFWDQQHGRRQYLERLLDAIAGDPEAAAHGHYFDAVGYHLYYKPLQAVQIIGEVRAILERHSVAGKEIWINETNAPPTDDAQAPPGLSMPYRVSQAEQSAFVIQEFALAFAAGAQRVAFNKLRDNVGPQGLNEPYGLLRSDDSRRPVFNAYRTMSTLLRGFRSVTQEQLGDVYAITFDRGERTTTLLWTMGRSDAEVTINAIASAATLVDEQGNSTSLNAVNARYTLRLPGASCSQGTDCFIGGAPRFLVEEGSAGSRPVLVPPTPTALPPTPTSVAPALPSPVPTQALTATASATPSADMAGTPSVTPATGLVAAVPTPASSPRPSPTPLPPVTPLSILTTSRCLILMLVGLAVFTFTYGLQVALWRRRH